MTTTDTASMILGILFLAFLHLIIPMIVALIGKPMNKIFIWLIAFESCVLGFVFIAFLSEPFRGLAGIFLSVIWTPISYLILSAKCSKNSKREVRVPLKRADKDIKNKLEEIEEDGEDKTEYIKRLIREDMKREQV